jgi:hypothetical protein
MNANHLQIRTTMHVRACEGANCGSCQENECRAGALLALLRRDWAGRVLDAWLARGEARGHGKFHYVTRWETYCTCHLRNSFGGERSFDAPTPDAARHEAAVAVWPELTHEQCQEIGACP